MPKYYQEFKMPPKLDANFDPEFFTEDAKMYAEDFLALLADLPGTEAIDHVWADNISALPVAERKAVAAALNEQFHALLGDEELVEAVRAEGAETIKQQLKDDVAALGEDTEAELLAMRKLSRAIIRTRELSGDKASPLVTVFAEAAKKSPGLEAFTKPMNAVIDAIARKTGKPTL